MAYMEGDAYERLAKSVILDAIQEFAGKDVRGRKNALKWFNERSGEVFGYGWCLSVSGMNPNVIRAKINELILR